MFVWLWCGCLSEVEWNLKLSQMRGNEMTFPNFHPCIYDLHEFKLFHHKTLEWRWYDFFHLNKWKAFWKDLNSIRKYFKFETLCNSMIFMREDKMTSSNYMKYELEVKKNQIESHLKVFWNSLSNLELFVFYSNYFSPKNK